MMNDHICNAWCHGTLHAHLVLISKSITTEQAVLSQVAPVYAQLHNRIILSARLAGEVDTETLIAAKAQRPGISATGEIRLHHDPSWMRAHMQAWLVIYSNAGQDESCSAPRI